MSKRRKFSAEFKRGAVEQASQPGVSCAQVARELGIRDTLLTRWKREAKIAAAGGLIGPSILAGVLDALTPAVKAIPATTRRSG